MMIAEMKLGDVERQRHPRPPGAGAGIHRTGAAGRAVPAGNQGVARPAAGLALRARRLLVLLARRQGLLGRRPARAQGVASRSGRRFITRSSTTSIASSRVRLPQATVASIYVPNGGKDFPAKMRFLEALDAYAAEFQASGLPLILCGDLNVARTDMDVHPKERKPRAIGQLPEERALIERILSRGLVDVHRQLEPDNADLFTWWAPWRNMKQRNIGWRLDYVFASQALAARATSCVVQREVGTSDHGPVVAVFDRAGRLSTLGTELRRRLGSDLEFRLRRATRPRQILADGEVIEDEVGGAERLLQQRRIERRGRRCGTRAPLRPARAPAPPRARARSSARPGPGTRSSSQTPWRRDSAAAAHATPPTRAPRARANASREPCVIRLRPARRPAPPT